MHKHDNTRNHRPISRRALLRGGLGASAGLLIGHAAGLAAQPSPKPTAKSVIQIWMWGGPSQLDTFDPKPDAGADYCGPFTKPIETNVPGIKIGEMLPELAKQADKYAIIRSMTHGINAHETGTYLVQTGRMPGEEVLYPSVGAVVSYFKGYRGGYKGLIPPYIVLTATQGRFSEAGFLGQRYKPFATGGDPAQTPFSVEGVVAEGICDRRQHERRELLRSLNTLGRTVPDNPKLAALQQCEDQAYNLILGDGAAVFDLSQESAELRERYGMTTFGQSCLAARRLVECGVPFITINYEGVGHAQEPLHHHAYEVARNGQGDGDAAGRSSGSRSAGQHDCMVVRRIRQNTEDPMGTALQRRPRSLGQRLLGLAGRGRVPRRSCRRQLRCKRRDGERAFCVSM
jgi:hypothetical protein